MVMQCGRTCKLEIKLNWRRKRLRFFFFFFRSVNRLEWSLYNKCTNTVRKKLTKSFFILTKRYTSIGEGTFARMLNRFVQ